MNIWEKLEKGLSIERKDARESVCMRDYWIIAEPDGKRILKPYRCGTCEECLNRKAIELHTKVSSMAYLNDMSVIKALPKVIDNIVKKYSTDDYVRFPSANGFDYLFVIDPTGIDFFKVRDEINWRDVIDRRSGTRKSGKLFYLKKSRDDELFKDGEQTFRIELRNLRSSSFESAQSALDKAVKFFKESEMNKKELKTVNEVEVYNNTVTMKIKGILEDSGDYIFTTESTKSYTLPVYFELRGEVINDK